MKQKILPFQVFSGDGLLSGGRHPDDRQSTGGLRGSVKAMIDWTRVTDLQDEIGADDFDEVVDMFLEEADDVIARITPDDGAKSLEADLHFLKGAALNLGFAALATLCQDGERRAAFGHNDIEVAAVKYCYAQSKTALAAGILAIRAA